MIANQSWNLKYAMVIQAVFFHMWKYYDQINTASKLLKWCCNLNFELYSDWTLKLRLWSKEALSQWKKNQTSNALADRHKAKHSTFWWWEKTFSWYLHFLRWAKTNDGRFVTRQLRAFFHKSLSSENHAEFQWKFNAEISNKTFPNELIES